MALVVVPAYNEEKEIGRTISGLFQHGYREVVVVDDGSMDNTATVARAAGATVLRHRLNRGQGAALQTGDEYALAHGADIVVHFDADGQFDPTDIAPALEKIESGQADVVFGSRFLDSRSRIPWIKKYLILPVARVVNWVFTGVWLSDAHNGFRLLALPALEKINITQAGMAHNTEILAQIKRNNLKYLEAPVKVRYHDFGQGIAGGFKIIGDLVWGIFTK